MTTTIIAALLLGAVIQSQESHQDQRLPVIVAIVDELPEKDATAVLLHRETAEPADIIILSTQTARPQVLAGALAVFLKDRALGAHGTSKKVLNVDGVPTGWNQSLSTYTAFLDELKKAPLRQLAGVGPARYATTKVYPKTPKAVLIDVASEGNPFLAPATSDGRIQITLVHSDASPAAPRYERHMGNRSEHVIVLNAEKTHARQLSHAVRKLLFTEVDQPAAYADDHEYPWAGFALESMKKMTGNSRSLKIWVKPIRSAL